jgi:hypothetical protein
MKKISIAFVLSFIIINVFSQEGVSRASKDELKIRSCLQIYFDAVDGSRPENMDQAFDAGAMVFWVDRDGFMDHLTQLSWKRLIGEGTKTTFIKREILNLSLTNTICVAKVRSQYKEKEETEYLALVKVHDDWKIVCKVFTTGNQISSTVQANEELAIRSVIETKLKSMDNNDPDLLASAYYARAMSFYNDAGRLAAVSIAEWVARFDYDKRKGNDRNTKAQRSIEAIDSHGNIGFVNFVHEFATDKVTDKVLMLKLNNRWRIINLMFTY